jgi:hypothetical protein
MAATANQPLTPQQEREISEIWDEERQLVRSMALNDLWFLINEVLWATPYPGMEITEAQFHYQEDLHKPLAEMVTSKAAPGCRKLVLMPRLHRKSYVMTVAHVVWRILNDPNIRILIVSALDSSAKRFLGVIKRIFQYNEGIKKYFPEFHVDPSVQFGDQTEFTHPLRTKKDLLDPTVRATYMGAPLASGRCDILICDDPIEKKHVTTIEQADKAIYFFNDLIPIVDKNPRYDMIFVIGTRWAFNDLYGALLGENRGDEAQAEVSSTTAYEKYVRHCLENAAGEPDFDNGKPIFHKVFTRASLLQMLEDYKIDPKKGEEDWWKQMMNVCQSPKGRKFEEQWFNNIWVDRLPSNIVWSGIAIDSATKDEQIVMTGDFTATLVGHFDAYGHLYLTWGMNRDDLKSPELMNQLVVAATAIPGTTPVTNIVKEKVGEEMFFGMVRSWFTQHQLPCTTYPCTVRGQGKKVVRITEALQAPFMARQIHFVQGFPMSIFNIIRDQLMHIGQWAHDDLADALSLFFHKDVRVRPAGFGAQTWEVRNTRLQQPSARTTNPMARWKTGMPHVAGSADGTLRDDPFVGQIGKSEDVAVGNLRQFIADRKVGRKF